MFDDDEIVARESLGELCKAFKKSRSDGVHSRVDRLLALGSSEFFEQIWRRIDESLVIQCKFGQ
jgi:hypothetical protein